jgi:hypothetical protein
VTVVLLAFVAGFLAGGLVADALARRAIRRQLARWDQQHPDLTNRRSNQ